ncbi:hypothetical protein TWF103_003363 [Orbilia oligospora]|nr:hypothetical protein TWF103_003363 [Orbilia oligospora]
MFMVFVRGPADPLIRRLRGSGSSREHEKIERINLIVMFDIPFPRNPNFIGRAEELRKINERFAASGYRDVPSIFAFAGTGGMGKTQIAAEYGYRHHRDYTAMFWVSAASKDTIETSFVDIMQLIVKEQARKAWAESAPDYGIIGQKLNIPGLIDREGKVSANPETIYVLQSVFFRWLSLPGNNKWLLIFDNADDLETFDIQKYFPKHGGGAILITSGNPLAVFMCGVVSFDCLALTKLNMPYLPQDFPELDWTPQANFSKQTCPTQRAQPLIALSMPQGINNTSSSVTSTQKTKSHSDYTIGWICALPKELTVARAMLDQEHPNISTPTQDENSYILGSIGKHNIVITCLPKGKVGTNEAAVAATEMLRTFSSIKVGLMVGIGGGIPSKVRLGDVVVSTPTKEYPGVVQWDFGKEETNGSFKRTGAMDNPPRVLLKAIPKLQATHDLEGTNIPQHLDNMKKKWPRLVPKYTWTESLIDPLLSADSSYHSQSNAFVISRWFGWFIWFIWLGWFARHSKTGSTQPNKAQKKPREVCVHYGLIASGNKVVKDAESRDRLNDILGGNVLCVEMEAAGLVRFPCLVIRGICDYADSQKNDDWQEYAAAVAAAYAKELLEYVQSDEVKQERPMKDILDQLKVASDNIAMVRHKLDKKEDLEILNWLTPIDYDDQQTDYFNKRQQGTGQWLLDSTEYQSWLRTGKQILFCPGIPGAGKTILTSTVVDDLTARFSDSSKIAIVYIYCNFRRKDEQDAQSLLASILKQLARGRPSLPRIVKELHKHHNTKQRRTRPSIDKLVIALESVSKEYERVFIIVDALDECQLSNYCRQTFLPALFQLHTKCDANIFATSRFIPEITEEFENSTKLEIFAHEEDVRNYLDAQISNSGKQLLINNREEVKTRITTVVSGMFLLAQLHFETIKNKKTLTKIRDALETLPTGKKAYDHAYEGAMTRIQGQDPDSKGLADEVLSWITCAKRPLTTSELQHALAVKIGQSKLDKDNFPGNTDMVSVCAGLVTIDEESNIIRLVHYTTQEYFERTWERWFCDAETNIAKVCVTYLSHDVFKAGPSPTSEDFKARLRSNALYDYAAKHWGHHASAASAEKWEAKVSTCSQDMTDSGHPSPYNQNQSVSDLALKFLMDDAKTSASGQVLFDNSGWQCYGMHLVAYWGLDRIMIKLLGKICVDAKDSWDQTALFYAVERGNVEVAKLLLENGAQLDLEAKNRQRPLSQAVKGGSAAAVQLLLAKKVKTDYTYEIICIELKADLVVFYYCSLK